jgi:hypothetical protein
MIGRLVVFAIVHFIRGTIVIPIPSKKKAFVFSLG